MLTLPSGNRLLDALPQSDVQPLAMSARVLRLEAGTTTVSENTRMLTVDFPISALMAVEGTLADGSTYELASIGTEAFVEIDAALESDVALRTAYCRLGGEVIRVSLDDFQANLLVSPPFARRVRRAVRARVFVTEQNQLCNLKHTLPQRLARWMLVTEERLGRSEVSATHDVLASILGNRRASVTLAAGSLEAQGAIERQRGRLVIRDLRLLAEACCECYLLCRRAIEGALTPEA